MSRRLRKKHPLPAARPAPALAAPAAQPPWLVPAICALLAALIFCIYFPVLGFGFVRYDDGSYVFDNPAITGGLSFSSFLWAFTHVHSDNWHPLTTLTHMLDCQIYGLHPWGHHLGNILLHAATAILLFLFLARATSALWPAALAAAIFAVHPLRVESVAWVSERKDVLSGLFFTLTLLAYLRYTRGRRSFPGYLLVLLCFLCGLMSKPTVVTLPFILLLLDFWPLRRFSLAPSWRHSFSQALPLLIEKIPFFLLSAGSCFATILAQKHALVAAITVSFPYRVANGLAAYAIYILQTFWPVDLAVLYPHPADSIPLWQPLLAALLLAAITAAAFLRVRQWPWLIVGWLWFLGALIPVIGIIQVGEQARADRYTYLPQIGLCIIIAWAAAAIAAAAPRFRWPVQALCILAIPILAIAARHQTTWWHDTESLWGHDLDCTTANYIADSNMALSLFNHGHIQEALARDQHALQVAPGAYITHSDLGAMLFAAGRTSEAAAQFQQALRLNPDYSPAHFGIGDTLMDQGQIDLALAHYRRAVAIEPDYLAAHNHLGLALFKLDRIDDAIAEYRTTLHFAGRNKEALYLLGLALSRKGSLWEAVGCYQKALAIDPGDSDVQNNLAYLLSTAPDPALRDGSRAVALAEKVNTTLGGKDPGVLDTLAAAYAEQHRFPDAVSTARKALDLAKTQGNTELSTLLAAHLQLFTSGRPLRESSGQ